jgi:hypothetical protein
MDKDYEGLNTYAQDEQQCPMCGHVGEMTYLQYADLWTCQMCGTHSEPDDTDSDVSRKLFEDKVAEIMAIDIEGFDAEWVLEMFSRKVCLRATVRMRDLATEQEYADMARLFVTGKTGADFGDISAEVADRLRVVAIFDRLSQSLTGKQRSTRSIRAPEAVAELDDILKNYLKYLVPNKGSNRLN